MWNPVVRECIDSLPDALRRNGLYPEPVCVNGQTTRAQVEIEGKEYLNFSACNYLGLATHEKVINAAIEGLERYGLAACASRLICGTTDAHLLVERELADLHKTEDAAIFFMVTQTSAASISTVLGGESSLTGSRFFLNKLGASQINGSKKIFYDWYSHPSLVWAAIEAVGKDNLCAYHHLDMEELEKKLWESSENIKLIVTDGLFSSIGTVAPLDEIVKLAKKYEAILLVDDAHASGVLGENGRGTCELFGVEDEVDIKIGSLSKAFAGGFGGYVVGDRNMIDSIRFTGRYINTGAPPPAMVYALLRSIQISREEPWRRQKVLSIATYLRTRLKEYEFDTCGSRSQIVPILIGDEKKALTYSQQLLELGFLVTVFRFPAVSMGKAILRLCLMSSHEQEHIDRFVDALLKITDGGKTVPKPRQG